MRIGVDIDDVTEKAAHVLMSENVSITDIDILDTIVRAGYPDLRRVINLLQEYTIDGVLTLPTEGTSAASWEEAMIVSIKENNFDKVYNIAKKNVALDEYDALYTFLGNNVAEPQGILFIADYMFKSAFVCDQDINFRALCIKLQKMVN